MNYTIPSLMGQILWGEMMLLLQYSVFSMSQIQRFFYTQYWQ